MLEHDYLPSIGKEIEELGIKNGVIAGGSYSYKKSQFDSLQEIRDLDILIVLGSFEDLASLLTEKDPPPRINLKAFTGVMKLVIHSPDMSRILWLNLKMKSSWLK